VLPGLTAGRTMQAETRRAEQGRWKAPTKPVIAIIGGAKVSTKIELFGKSRSQRSMRLVIGRRHGQTRSCTPQGVGIGKSLAEKDLGGDRAADLRKGGSRQLRHHPNPWTLWWAFQFRGPFAVSRLRPRCDNPPTA